MRGASARLALLPLLLVAIAAPLVAGPPPTAATPSGGGESLAVELLVLPFYAVDARGEAVLDLTVGDVRVEVGGRQIAPDTLDRSDFAAGAGAAAPPAVRQPADRNVYLLVDQAFLSPAGLHHAQQAIALLLDALPPSDRLVLLVNDPQRGLTQRLGPLIADARGKRRVRDQVDAIRPSVRRLDPTAEAHLM